MAFAESIYHNKSNITNLLAYFLTLNKSEVPMVSFQPIVQSFYDKRSNKLQLFSFQKKMSPLTHLINI